MSTWVISSRSLLFSSESPTLGILPSKRQHFFEVVLAVAQQHEAVEADGDAAAIGKASVESCDEVFIDGKGVFAKADTFLVFFFEAPALFVRIGEFMKSVGEFDATEINLKTFSDGFIFADRGLGEG